jgi:glycine cleavage system aminomethyltransferase T
VLLSQRQQGVNRRLVQFALNDPTPLLYHNEPIWRNGVIVGRISSGMFGHALGQSLGMGYVENTAGLADKDFVMGGSYEIEVAGVKVAATASLAPFYDPGSARIKGTVTATEPALAR